MCIHRYLLKKKDKFTEHTFFSLLLNCFPLNKYLFLVLDVGHKSSMSSMNCIQYSVYKKARFRSIIYRLINILFCCCYFFLFVFFLLCQESLVQEVLSVHTAKKMCMWSIKQTKSIWFALCHFCVCSPTLFSEFNMRLSTIQKAPVSFDIHWTTLSIMQLR